MGAEGSSIANLWAQEFAKSIGSMSGKIPATATAPLLHAEAATNELVWFGYNYDLGTGPLFTAGASDKVWTEIGDYILKAAGVDDGTPEDTCGSYFEVLSQAASSLAREFSGRVGRSIVATRESGLTTPPNGVERFRVTFQLGSTELEVIVAASQELLELLTSVSSPPEKHPDAPRERTPAAAAERGKSVDVLLDVELPVSVSFGRARLPLRDVLKLTTGSIVELNRNVTEPVEVIVNNCVIARGDVVVVEGNFGVRIRQVMSRQDRLQSVK